MRLLKGSLRVLFSKKKKQKDVSAPILNTQQLQNLKVFKNQTLPLNIGKILPSSQRKNTLITSALPYVNNVPHLGNIIGALLSADVIARFKRLNGQNVLFVCGTDQYGTATEVKAKQVNKTPKQICDQYHSIHKQIYKWFKISYDHFGRTSDPIHTEIVQQIFLECYQNGFFVQKQMHQLYCKSCTMFLADRFVVGNCKSCKSFTKADQCDSCNKVFSNPQNDLQNIKCSICSSTPQIRNTTHLFFNFQKNPTLKQKLHKWLHENNRIQNWSNNAKGQTKNWLKQNVLKDRCMTRDLKWGISVPLQKFKDKVFYVWFDAPIGYISISKQLLGDQYKNWWLKNKDYDVQLIQFMGKDNIMFHSILFPSTLLSTSKQQSSKYNLVNRLSVTQYLRYEGGKFSKSQNRGVFGSDCQKTQIQSDVWRYYLLSNRPQFYDAEFLWSQFAEKNNKQLMNSIGNLYNRILKVATKTFDKSKQLPKLETQKFASQQKQLLKNFKQLTQKYTIALNNLEIKKGSEILLQMSFLLNKYVQDTQFWKNKERKNQIISFLLRNLCVFGRLMEPYLPQTSARIYYLLGVQNHYEDKALESINKNFQSYLLNCLDNSTRLKQPILLFTQINQQKITSLSLKYGKNQKISLTF